MDPADQRGQHRGEGDLERQAGAVDEPGEQVAAEDVGAEGERPARPGHPVLRNHPEGTRAAADGPRRAPHDEERADDQEARERGRLAHERDRHAAEASAASERPGRRSSAAGSASSPG